MTARSSVILLEQPTESWDTEPEPVGPGKQQWVIARIAIGSPVSIDKPTRKPDREPARRPTDGWLLGRCRICRLPGCCDVASRSNGSGGLALVGLRAIAVRGLLTGARTGAAVHRSRNWRCRLR